MTAIDPAWPAWTHAAMSTRFRAVLLHPDHHYARQAAEAVFGEVDRLERQLSRFVEESDVSRINRLAVGQHTTVQPDTFDCLRIAERIRCETGGIFDVAYRSGSGTDGAGPVVGDPRFRLHAEKLQVQALVSGLCVDLGGIGKGFALDRMCRLLSDWEVDTALLAAGTSTLLARGVPAGQSGWALTIGSDRRPVSWTLVRGAISASGTAARGEHLVDPRTGRPESRHHRVWAAAPTAAVADALSTAFSLMTAAEIQAYCQPRASISAWLLDDPDGELRALRT